MTKKTELVDVSVEHLAVGLSALYRANISMLEEMARGQSDLKHHPERTGTMGIEYHYEKAAALHFKLNKMKWGPLYDDSVVYWRDQYNPEKEPTDGE